MISPFSQTGPMKLCTLSLIPNASFKAVPSSQFVFLDNTLNCRLPLTLARAWLKAPDTVASDGSPGTVEVEGIRSPIGSDPEHSVKQLQTITNTKNAGIFLTSKFFFYYFLETCKFNNSKRCAMKTVRLRNIFWSCLERWWRGPIKSPHPCSVIRQKHYLISRSTIILPWLALFRYQDWRRT